MSACTLCGGPTEHYHQDKRRNYFECQSCSLVQVPTEQRLSLGEEKAEYDKHENNADDPGYRRFLSRMLEPMLAALSQSGKSNPVGLDFGSGPEPVLQRMFSEQGVEQEIYDVFYAHESARLSTDAHYDFITTTEVVEHLHSPGLELERLWSLLIAGGTLGIMTKRVSTLEAFQQWHYKNDPTHVCFFSTATFEYLANKWNAELNIISADVVIFKKKF